MCDAAQVKVADAMGKPYRVSEATVSRIMAEH